MGNICNNEHKDPTVYQRGSRPITSIIRTYLGYSDDSEN